jgi:hypothetical protein
VLKINKIFNNSIVNGIVVEIFIKNTHQSLLPTTDEILPTPMAPPSNTPVPWPGHLLNKKSSKHAGSKVLKVV